jgi:hypothetical protein
MGKLIVVQNDVVTGTDTHNVTGPAPPPPGTIFTGTSDYDYAGKVTLNLSTFVTIGGKAVALVTSQCTLDSPHVPFPGKNLKPTAPVPTTLTFVPPPPTGIGAPNSGAGSALLTVGGVKVLLDGDKMDTCSGTGSANSSVAASGNTFVKSA